MFKLSRLFENSVTKVGGTETSIFGPIPQSGDFRSNTVLFYFFVCLLTIVPIKIAAKNLQANPTHFS